MGILNAVDSVVAPAVRGLGYRARRHAAISANVANADTPGYRTVDVTFGGMLERSGLALRATHPEHRRGVRAPAGDQVVLTGGLQRKDGNDVDVDAEMVKLAQNQIEYQFLTRALGGKFSKLKEAITGKEFAVNFFDMMNVTASGLAAQRLRMETVASNLANANATRTADGGPYQRRDVIFEAVPAGDFRDALDAMMRRVEVTDVVQDSSPPRLQYEPGHPDADPQGYVAYPNVDPVVEMVNLLGAARSYEANLTVIEATKNLMLRTLEI